MQQTFLKDNKVEYKNIEIDKLKPFPLREVRPDVIERLKERIQQRGYNPARPVSVIKNNGDYLVIDGNHRLRVAIDIKENSLPCAIYGEGENIYKLAIEGNLDEDTYAPMDLFDWLDIIKKLKNEGLTQKEIGVKIGWSRDKVKDYIELFNNIGEHILNLCKIHQIGRSPKNGEHSPFEFTIGWFGTSGLYDLKPVIYQIIEEEKPVNYETNFQEKVIKNFIKDNCKWNKTKLQQETAKYKLWTEFIEISMDKLADLYNMEIIYNLIVNDTFKIKEVLLKKIEELNKQAENKLICGDALIELEKLEDATIDIVITDPPYGIDYISNRGKYSGNVASEGIENDKTEEAFPLLEKTCEVLNRKTKADAHLYFFTSWKVYPEFKQIIEEHFIIKNLIIWDKGNHGAGDLEGAWGEKYEMIIFATKGSRSLQKRKQDIIAISKIHSSQLIHPTQKPVELIKELIDASAGKTDTICDPFMGSGSAIKAVKELKDLDLRYIGIEIDKEFFERARGFINEQ